MAASSSIRLLNNGSLSTPLLIESSPTLETSYEYDSKHFLPPSQIELKAACSNVHSPKIELFPQLATELKGIVCSYLDNRDKVNLFRSSKELHCLSLKGAIFQYHFEPVYMFIITEASTPFSFSGHWREDDSAEGLAAYPNFYTRSSLAKQVNKHTRWRAKQVFDSKEASYPKAWECANGYAIVKCWVIKGTIKEATKEDRLSELSDEKASFYQYRLLPRNIYIHDLKAHSNFMANTDSHQRALQPLQEKELKRIVQQIHVESKSSLNETPMLQEYIPDRTLDVLHIACQEADDAYNIWFQEGYGASDSIFRSLEYGFHMKRDKSRANNVAQQIMESDDFDTALNILKRHLASCEPIHDTHSFEAFLIQEIIKQPLLQKKLNIPSHCLVKKHKITLETYNAIKNEIIEHKAIYSNNYKAGIGVSSVCGAGILLGLLGNTQAVSVGVIVTIGAAIPLYGWILLLAVAAVALGYCIYKNRSNQQYNASLFPPRENDVVKVTKPAVSTPSISVI